MSARPSSSSGPGPHLFLAACIALVAGFGTWAAVGRLDIVSTAVGRVVPASHVQEVQHLEGGIVADILVREGARVDRGQPLVVLEPTRSGADVAQMRVRMDGHLVAIARLEAQAAWADAPSFPAEVAERRPAVVAEAGRLFTARRARVESQLEAQDKAIAQRAFEVREITARLNGNRKSLKLVEEQMEISRKLLELDLTNRMKHLDLEREGSGLRSRIAEDGALLPKAKAAIEEARTRGEAIRQSFVEEARGALEEQRVALDELAESVRKAEDSLQRTVLRSPTNGVVKTLYVTSIGGVVSPGGRVADVVPADDRLVIEAQLANSEVGYVHTGQEAMIRLASADALRFGPLAGTVSGVSPDALVTEEGAAFYLVRIETEAQYFEKGDLRHELIPGMQVQCSIRTGSRTVYQYLLEPYLGSFSLALQER